MSEFIIGGSVLLLLIVVTLILGRRARVALTARYPPPGRMVDVGGYRMHINCLSGERSDGRPMVVLEAAHGEFSPTWASVQGRVAQFAKVCSYDRAGLGWSERSPKPRTAANIVDELHTLLTIAGVEPPYVLVGHSMGGLYSRFYAHAHREEVAGMVLVDSSHKEQDVRLPERLVKLSHRSYSLMTWLFRLLQMLNSVGLLALLPGGTNRLWPSPIPEKARETYLGVVLSDTRHFETASRETAAIRENLAAARAAQIATLGDIPLVVLSAGKTEVSAGFGLSAEDVDQMTAVLDQCQTELAALSPQGRREVIEDSGHYIPVEKPDAVVDAIRQVVEELGG